MAKTTSVTIESVDAEIQEVEAARAALVDRHAQVEAALAEPGAPAELAAELVTLGARIKAAAGKLAELAQRRQEVEHANVLALAAQRLGEIYAAETELAALDAEIDGYKKEIARLAKLRKPIAEARQLASGRLSKIHREARAAGLAAELRALRDDFDKARRTS